MHEIHKELKQDPQMNAFGRHKHTLLSLCWSSAACGLASQREQQVAVRDEIKTQLGQVISCSVAAQ